MNWDAVSAIAEMVGAVAVVTTLAYLALQVRQSTVVNASSIRQGFYDYTTRQMLHGTDSTEFSALLNMVIMKGQSPDIYPVRPLCIPLHHKFSVFLMPH